jgi:hypothetical protein
MPRPFTRAQALQNRAFLEALASTGNARLAARALGVHRSTYLKRRAADPTFAARWDAALLASQLALAAPAPAPAPAPASTPLRTAAGDLALARSRSGKVQLRRARAGRMTKAAEQLFLAALSASANVRLAAAAAGFAHSSFYALARRSPAFAREMRLALEMGYERLEGALLEGFCAESYEDDSWRHNEPPPIAPMTPDQALQLLHLHQKSVHQSWDQPHRRKRRGESWDVYSERLRAMWAVEQSRAAERESLRRAALNAGRHTPHPADRLPALPALDQVAGWSKADPSRPKHNPDVAMFGGWRLENARQSGTSPGKGTKGRKDKS